MATTMQHAQEEMRRAAQQYPSTLSTRFDQVRYWMQDRIQNLTDTLRVYVNRYPPLAAFLFTLMALSAVPVTVFLLFAAGSIAVTMTIAMIGWGIVEGGMLLFGGGVLMLVLGGIGLFTTIAFAWITAIWLVYRGVRLVTTGMFGNVAQGILGTVSSVAGKASEYASSVTGMPTTTGVTPGAGTSSMGYGSTGMGTR